MALYKSVYYYYYFDPGTQFPGNEKNYAMQYKKVQKSSWNEPDSSSLLLLLLSLIFSGAFSQTRASPSFRRLRFGSPADHVRSVSDSTASWNWIRYDTRCYFNVRSKADMSQLNLPHGADN